MNGAATDTESFVLVMDDPDATAVAGKTWVHWLVWNIPSSTTTIPGGWEPQAAVVGENDFGVIGYDGPDPPDAPHTCRLKLFALDTALELARGATASELGAELTDHVIAQTTLTGTNVPD